MLSHRVVQVKAVLPKSEQEFGPVEVVVTCAGASHPGKPKKNIGSVT